MAQTDAWENEYRNPQLITGKAQPQNDVLRFFKYLKKDCHLNLKNLKVLDLGSGTGRNSNYLASLGNEVTGIEISKTALKIAQDRADDMSVKVKYLEQSIGQKFPFPDNYFDIILDITSSNSLNETERSIYLKETSRVLSPNGYFFIRALCKEGDKNAQNLLKLNPGPEKDTYRIKELNLTERVFSPQDFQVLYSSFFNIISLIKKKGYARFQGQNYKRIYLLAILRKSNLIL